jgi:Flp pilus assembly protein TadG
LYVPVMAVLMIFLVGLMAFALDIGWMVMAQSELQNCADAAALAGAGQLMDGYVQYNLPGQTQKAAILANSESQASTYAKNFASYNTAGGSGNLVLLDSDVEFGFTDASLKYTAPAPAFPNTVKVTLRRDSTANNPLGLFFGQLLGMPSVNLQASAAATIYTGNVIDFASNLGNPGILPMTLDVNAWNNYLATGLSSDGLLHPVSLTNLTPQMQVYPSPLLAPGNFGLLSLDDSSNSDSAVAGWIANGLPAGDVATLHTSGLLPLKVPNPNLWTWKGDPGFKASDVNDLTVGTTFLLPLFKPVSTSPYQATTKDPGGSSGSAGVGQNSYYDIVQFVGVKITEVDNSTAVFIQPYGVYDRTILLDPTTLAPAGAGTSTTLQTTFALPKLTQ